MATVTVVTTEMESHLVQIQIVLQYWVCIEYSEMWCPFSENIIELFAQ